MLCSQSLLYLGLFNFYTALYVIILVCLAVVFLVLSLTRFAKSEFINFFYFKMTYFNFVIVMTIFIFLLLMFKISCLFFFGETWLSFLAVKTLNNNCLIAYLNFISYGQYSSYLGWSLLLLCFLTSALSLFYLGDRNIFSKGSSASYFTFFLFCTTLMINSTNLLVVFFSFEFIFFPSLYFVYSLGYVKKVDKAIYFLLAWTLCGSFLVLCAFAYIYSIHDTLEYTLLLTKQFSFLESFFLFFSFFLGFGIKLPIFPFHYWLTKVHVEAPAGFSMFLSGFLVKTALYCFYFLALLFNSFFLKKCFLIWISFCIAEASVKMWNQVDIKKLVAFATIQEMNMILLCVLLFQVFTNSIILLFILMHGILSTYMFFLVDQVQKRAQTRNILALSGFCTKFPFLRIYIWIMLLFYLGFPFTVKFALEWHVASLLLVNLGFGGFLTFFFALVFGGIGFTKCWLLIMYGNPSPEINALKTVDFVKKDRYFSFFLILCLFFLNFFFF